MNFRYIKTRGLIFVVIVSAVYWWFFYMRVPGKGKNISAVTISAAEKEAPARRENRQLIEEAVEKYKQKYGRNPENLGELVENKFLDEIPDSGNRSWMYFPEDGKIK